MTFGRLSRLWQDLRRPLPPPERVMLGERTGLTCRELREQVLVIGTPEQTRQGAGGLLQACVPHGMTALALTGPGDAFPPGVDSGSDVHRVTSAAEADQAVHALFEWSQARSSRYTPDVWPFMLLVTPGLPSEVLDVVLHWIPALRGHNFAVIVCLSPEQVQPGMRWLFGNVMCWADGFSAARGLRPTDLAPPGPGEAALLTSRAGGAHLTLRPGR
ncbi:MULTISPECIES: hypothetical protein [Deinococcus]|uniref:Uncharacterized protein n=2 Tax=Deinococcus TaxID=1298 RepID=A0A221T3H0_9DEIO|nr:MULTISPECIES: hypothetical protein [Deinococcus]ASN83443.1 hypothetical protein DFI_19795 [Deinococcus ficus]MDP9766513.1 hypothetical protein [Deinococcus enclensis]